MRSSSSSLVASHTDGINFLPRRDICYSNGFLHIYRPLLFSVETGLPMSFFHVHDVALANASDGNFLGTSLSANSSYSSNPRATRVFMHNGEGEGCDSKSYVHQEYVLVNCGLVALLLIEAYYPATPEWNEMRFVISKSQSLPPIIYNHVKMCPKRR